MPLDPKTLAREAAALKAAGRLAEAIERYRQAVGAAPSSAVAEHNLAAALGDAGRWREAEDHLRAAFAKGARTPHTVLVWARCLESLGRFDEAEAAYHRVLDLDPRLHAAHRELAQLRWMRTASAEDALAVLREAFASEPNDVPLALVMAQALEHVGRWEEALALLSRLAADHPNDPAPATAAAQLHASKADPQEAIKLAERAVLLAPDDSVAGLTLATALLAQGEAERASPLVARWRAQRPNDQYAIAVQATAWRLLDDPRYQSLYDYDRLVDVSSIEAPGGWETLDAYLNDLAEGLRSAHTFRSHPFDQSIKHGSQISDVLYQDHPALRAMGEAVDRPIRRYLSSLGLGEDPVRRRNTGAYEIQGMWSIRMEAGGFHIDHVHPNGWISSACYVEKPNLGAGKAGWLKLGEPGIRTAPHLPAERFVEPKRGQLVLFPSYMWHGTVPFSEPGSRMTVAFDLTPQAKSEGGVAG